MFTKQQYRRYLDSEQWHRLKAKRAKLDNGRCQMCGRTTNLECHHINYKTFGCENVYTDLVTLCKGCHKGVHRMLVRVTGYNPDGSIRHGWQTTLPEYIKEDLMDRGLM